ncbi:MAG: ATPase [Kofleriaceae bacterium]|nr:ATPase [Kofleriaceae bacterium]
MSASPANRLDWDLDREIVITRVFDAPRALVFKLFTQAEHICQWWGPKGFTCNTHSMNVQVGGQWRFDLVAPNGHVYPNRIEYVEIAPNERLVFDHGSDQDDDPGKFRVTITFDEQSDKKTVVMMRQLHPTKAQRDATIGFGAVELGYQTLDKLAELLRANR